MALAPVADRPAFEPAVIQPAYVEKIVRDLALAVLRRTDGDARTLLHETLNTVQPDTYSWTADASQPDVQFDAEGGLREAVLRRVMVVDELPANWEVEPDLRPQQRRCLERALARLATVDPDMKRSLTTLIGAFLFGRLDHFGGGSNSSVIGCVWLNPNASWTDADWLENVFHEYVHQCLFIDDMRHGLFAHDGEVLSRNEALVRSALLQTPRPYDRSYHSAFVSFALMQLNMRLGITERVVDHVEPLRTTLEQLQEKSRFLTTHGSTVLDSLCTAFALFQQHPALSVPC